MDVNEENSDNDSDNSDELYKNKKRGPYKAYLWDESIPIPKSTKHDHKKRTAQEVKNLQYYLQYLYKLVGFSSPRLLKIIKVKENCLL